VRIPVSELESSAQALSSQPVWGLLDAEAKREHLLEAAGRLFSREGLDAPMPAVAAAAGAGVGSIYRQFPSKYELIAALVVRRLDHITEIAERACAGATDSWFALEALLWTLAEEQSRDDLLGEALAGVAEHPDVVVARNRTTAQLELVLVRARQDGRLREDVTVLDLRLLFAATRAADQVEVDGWRRMLVLLLGALASPAS
jgi:AcrR family transcriptional regulator